MHQFVPSNEGIDAPDIYISKLTSISNTRLKNLSSRIWRQNKPKENSYRLLPGKQTHQEIYQVSSIGSSDSCNVVSTTE